MFLYCIGTTFIFVWLQIVMLVKENPLLMDVEALEKCRKVGCFCLEHLEVLHEHLCSSN